MSDRERGERGSVEGGRAAEARDVGREARGGSGAADEGVLTLVCFKCGTEYYFAEGDSPQEMICAKCGNTVFRSFLSPEENEATADFEETTGRDLDADDAEGETLPGDVSDLNRG